MVIEPSCGSVETSDPRIKMSYTPLVKVIKPFVLGLLIHLEKLKLNFRSKIKSQVPAGVCIIMYPDLDSWWISACLGGGNNRRELGQ